MKPALSRGFHLVFIATLVAGLGLAFQPVPVAYAATIPVAAGVVDINPADGQCSLIEAIENANDTVTGQPHADCVAGDPAGADTIELAAGATYTLTAALPPPVDGPNGLPNVTTQITINGNGATIRRGGGAPNFRIFHVGGAGNLTLNDVTIRNGNAGIDAGGGIYNRGTLMLNRSTVSGNHATFDYGGGIENFGTLTLNRSTVSDNHAGIGGGGITSDGTLTVTNSTVGPNNTANYGGGISNGGTLTLDSSTVSGNEADYDGGGIDNWGTLTLNRSTISGNTATSLGGVGGNGGGIYNEDTLMVTNSTISGNTAGNGGGGIFHWGTLTLDSSTVGPNNTATNGGGIAASSDAPTTITNSTISGNTASATGGGISNLGGGGTLEVTNSTISGNGAATGGGINNWAVLRVYHSTISDNTGGGISDLWDAAIRNTIVAAQAGGTDCFGSITSDGYNLDSDGTCDLTQATDQPNTNPNLVPLADNGGPTQTHALPLGSPAIDTGDPACPATDQRGVARPLDGDGDTVAACDSGAYEAPAILGIVKVFAPDLIGENGVSTLTFTITNPDAGTDLTGVAFTDNLPGGVVVAPLPNVANTCGVGSTVTAAAGTISLADGTLAEGGTCQVSVDVTSAAAGVYVNTSGAVTSTEITDGGTATATLTVTAPGGGGGPGGDISEGTVGPGGLTLGDGCAKIIVEAGAYPVGSIVAFDSNPSPDNAKAFGDFRLDDVLFFRIWVRGPDGAPMTGFSPPLLVCAQPCRGGDGTTLFDWDEAAMMWRAWPTFVPEYGWHCTDWYGDAPPPPPGDQSTSGDQAVTGAQTSAEAGQTVVVEAPAAGRQVASAPSIGLPETGAPSGVSGLARIAFGLVIGLGMISGGVMLGRRAS